MENLVMETTERSVIERAEQRSAPPPDKEAPMACTFQVKNLSIWYGEKRAIDDVTLDITEIILGCAKAAGQNNPVCAVAAFNEHHRRRQL